MLSSMMLENSLLMIQQRVDFTANCHRSHHRDLITERPNEKQRPVYLQHEDSSQTRHFILIIERKGQRPVRQSPGMRSTITRLTRRNAVRKQSQLGALNSNVNH